MQCLVVVGLIALSKSIYAQHNLPNSKDNDAVLCEYNNRTFVNGESWYVENFLFQCQTDSTGWKADIMACKWNRTNEMLAVNASKRYRKWAARCYREGDTVKWEEREMTRVNQDLDVLFRKPAYPEGLKCIHDDESFDPDQEWEVGNFMLRCVASFENGKWSWDVEITGCKWTKHNVQLKVDQSKTIGLQTARCYQNAQGTVKLEESESLPLRSRGEFEIKSSQPKTSCNSEGGLLKVGDSVREGQFRYTCLETGDVKVAACITDNKTDLLVGRVEVNDGVLHQCIEFNGQAFYRTETFIAESSKSALFHTSPVEGERLRPDDKAPGNGAPASSNDGRPGNFHSGAVQHDSFFGVHVPELSQPALN